jgi:hypothetical protein
MLQTCDHALLRREPVLHKEMEEEQALPWLSWSSAL